LILEIQDDALATHAPKISKSEGLLDWERPALELERKIRAFLPWPGAYFEYEGEQFKVLEAQVLKSSETFDELTIQTGQDILKITQIQRSGHKAMSADEFLRGFSFKNGIKKLAQ
jgi:methionyl-tRNA formyltransferase